MTDSDTASHDCFFDILGHVVFCLASVVDFPEASGGVPGQHEFNDSVVLGHISVGVFLVDEVDSHRLVPPQLAYLLQFFLNFLLSHGLPDAEDKADSEVGEFYLHLSQGFIKDLSKSLFGQPLNEVPFLVVLEQFVKNGPEFDPLIAVECELAESVLHIGLENVLGVNEDRCLVHFLVKNHPR